MGTSSAHYLAANGDLRRVPVELAEPERGLGPDEATTPSLVPAKVVSESICYPRLFNIEWNVRDLVKLLLE